LPPHDRDHRARRKGEGIPRRHVEPEESGSRAEQGLSERIEPGIEVPATALAFAPTELRDALDVLRAWHRLRAETLEVRGVDLAVDEPEVPFAELSREPHEGDLRRVGLEREHAVAAEEATDRHTEESADESLVAPCLHAVR